MTVLTSSATVVDYGKLRGWVNANQGQLVFNTDQGPNKGNFDLIERIPAGYVMNTIDLSSHIRMVTGLRIEATHVDTTSFDKSTNALSFKAGGDYLDILPSGSLRFALDKRFGPSPRLRPRSFSSRSSGHH